MSAANASHRPLVPCVWSVTTISVSSSQSRGKRARTLRSIALEVKIWGEHMWLLSSGRGFAWCQLRTSPQRATRRVHGANEYEVYLPLPRPSLCSAPPSSPPPEVQGGACCNSTPRSPGPSWSHQFLFQSSTLQGQTHLPPLRVFQC